MTGRRRQDPMLWPPCSGLLLLQGINGADVTGGDGGGGNGSHVIGAPEEGAL